MLAEVYNRLTQILSKRFCSFDAELIFLSKFFFRGFITDQKKINSKSHKNVRAQNFRHVIFKIELVHNFVEGLELRQ